MIEKLIAYMRQTPMYRSMLYFLLTLVAVAIGLSIIGTLPYDPLDILLTSLYLMAICWAGSWGLGKLFKANSNPESSLITGLILALIFGPMPLSGNLGTLTFVGLVAAASKYLLVWRKSHIFNPAAFAAVATAIILGTGASWWVGSIYLLPLVLVGGLYEAYKTSRLHLILSFLAAYAVLFILKALFEGTGAADSLENLWTTLRYSPILFFTFVMLIEPLTSPAERSKRIYYGVLTALLVVFLPEILPSTGYTLELSLLAGNVFAVFLSGNQGRLLLKLTKKDELAPNIMGFWFEHQPKRQFKPGQFLHYTLPHRLPDMRGSRRFFSIASSPTEDEVLLVTKFAEKSSSFKKALKSMKTDDEITALRPEGEFVMPENTERPLVLVAGGIGVTPYRSMVKYLLDKNQKRPITLVYGAKNEGELVFKDLFDKAEKTLGLKTVYALDDPPNNWKGEKGPLSAELIKKHASDPKALFYVSGPEPMVRSLITQLKDSGVQPRNIEHDYFPGYSKN